MAAYLFAHFIGEQKDGEQIYFAVSQDGLHWKDLNGGDPVLYSHTGTCGVRDPFLVRDPQTGTVYMIATDLRIEAGRGWTEAQENGSRSIIVWETEDLVHWTKERSHEVGIPGAGCVWAPEAVYDKEKEAFLVFFASKVKNEGETAGKHRIYATYTKDFQTFSETFLYMEKEQDVIDTTILESGGQYYRVSKDETEKRLILERADSLTGAFARIDSPVLAGLNGVEGPEGYLLPDGRTWCLIADQFMTGKGYLPMLTEDLSSGDFKILTPEAYDMGRTKKRHGGVLQITDAEYVRLLQWQSHRTLTIKENKGTDIPKEFVGLFIEDINYAVDGGLHAELLENRNFESLEAFGGERKKDYCVKHDGLYAWRNYPADAKVQLSVIQGSPVSMNNPHYLRVEAAQEKCGFANKAYDGIYMRPGMKYTVSFYARCVDYQGSLTIAIVKDKNTVCEKSVETESADAFGWNQWVRYELDLCAEREVRNADFVVLLESAGTVEFDHFSMMPADAVCGVFRRDLAECLKDLHPGFLRFPGGCIVEGSTLANRYRFKDTLGRREDRRYNWNRWATHENSEENGFHSVYAHYGQTYGIGFYEYFLLCEYLGAKPLPVLGVGLACQFQSHEKVDLDSPEIDEYIQEYLDLIEFANGGTDTRWGAVRAQMGHEAPFGLEMVGVGNEQWENGESRFFDRYQLFEQKIHKVYPEIKLIGTAGPELDSPRFQAAWDFYSAHEEAEDFVYAVDEHYYVKPEWLLAHTDYFDTVSRRTKIFFGEYAAHTTAPVRPIPEKATERNTLEAALAEAAFMTGMARNSDVVVMTCYAPLLARIGYAQWNPDLIWFDDKNVCRTPSYYVQQMFAANPGDYNIDADTVPGLPCQVSYDVKAGELIIKLVNASPEEQSVTLALDSCWKRSGQQVNVICLSGGQLSDINTLEKELIQPEEKNVSLANDQYQMPPCSFSVLRIPVEASV